MEIIAQIEIQNGKCVNLVRGEMTKPKVYDTTPLAQALEYEKQGATWLYIVDLDGVKEGEAQNHGLIIEIIQNTSIPVQVGGGIRTLSAVDWWLDQGASRVIMGTSAILDRHLVQEACARYPDRIIIGLDASGGKAVVRGWEEITSFDVMELGEKFEEVGAAGIIFTDVDSSRSQTASFAQTIELAERLNIPVYGSGIIKSLQDVEFLNQMPKVAGCIVGYALCEGKFTLKEALEIARQRTTFARSHV